MSTLHRSKIITDLKARSNPITIIQAIDDAETPPEVAREFVGEVGLKNLKYVELDTDHSFAKNREELKEMIAKKLEN